LKITTIVAVRHGETIWNKEGKQQGHLNSDLTKLGIRQAQALARSLTRYQFDAFYASDLGRTIHTATIISNKIKKDFITEARLRERNLGIAQGLTKADFKAQFPNEFEKFNSLDPEYQVPEGESLGQVSNRSTTFVNELVLKHPGETILIVSHGGILTSFIQKALNIPLNQKRRYSLYNTSINEFSISEDLDWRLELWGETHHLDQIRLEALDDD
jgi:2,3-bisphosphoglycerate-dependent phosphoglycerate mutase